LPKSSGCALAPIWPGACFSHSRTTAARFRGAPATRAPTRPGTPPRPSAAALHAGDVELALAAAQEAVDLCRDLDEGFHSAEAAVDLARALLETGEPQRAVELRLGSAGGEELVLIAGGPRAHYLEVLARCWLALDRPAEARRAAHNAKAWDSARCDTATRRNASCESSGIASTVARGRARPTEPGSSR